METPMSDGGPRPQRFCDLVMKGGIASGIVYPLAICELAKKFAFMNIGGTSAGAIAASLAAAAEYRRRHGDDAGFTKLGMLPRWLGTDNHLLNLFQPGGGTEPVFRVLTESMMPKRPLARLSVFVCSLIGNFGFGAAIGALPCAVLLIWIVSARAIFAATGNYWMFGFGILIAILLGLCGALLGAAIHMAFTALQVIPQNFFGICRGAGTRSSQVLPLTEWLADYIDEVSGKAVAGKDPLTFGDLARAKVAVEFANQPAAEHGINLRMMTTNLTHGRPYQLPFESRQFFFDPDQFGKLFPARVVDWMLKHAPEGRNEHEKTLFEQAKPLRPIPLADDLPVIVATRMSLSFPVLLSAIPLFAIDWSREENSAGKAAGVAPRWETCWFSDGGTSSNFPIHFFDSPLPRWPTFGLNLRGFHPDHPRSTDEAKNIWMPETNTGGILEWWNRFDSKPGLGRLGAFLGAILSAMQNWNDNVQLAVPGYRDRVAHISLDPDEGGMNLNMDSETIRKLGERGKFAGAKLRERFDPDSPPPNATLTWENHRWVRYRSAFALFEDVFGSIAASFRNAPAGTKSYDAMVKEPPEQEPSYQWKSNHKWTVARADTEELIQLAEKWAARDVRFSDGAPRPEPEFRIRPKI